MSTQIGRLINIGYALESERGTAESSAVLWQPKIEFDFNPRADYAVDESGLGIIDGRSDAKVVEKLSEGSFGGIVHSRSMGFLLAACMGTWSTGEVDDSSYTHSFTRLNTNQHPALTLFVDDENSDEKYALAMLNQLTINAVLKDYVRFSAGFMSKFPASTSSTPAYTAENQFLAQHVSVKFAASVAALTEASDVNLRAINLTVNKNVEDWQNLGSNEPADIVNKTFTVGGDMELLFDDETYRDYWTDGDKMACQITIENTDDLIGTESHPKLEISLAPMSFRDWGKNTGQDDITTQTVAFDGNFGITATKTISVDLVNAQSQYV